MFGVIRLPLVDDASFIRGVVSIMESLLCDWGVDRPAGVSVMDFFLSE